MTCLDCVDAVVVGGGEVEAAEAPPDSVQPEPEPLDWGEAGASVSTVTSACVIDANSGLVIDSVG